MRAALRRLLAAWRRWNEEQGAREDEAHWTGRWEKFR